MCTKDNYFFDNGGHTFEAGVVDIVLSFAKSEWGHGAVKFSTMKQDFCEGTDVSVLGVPIDVTLAFGKKNKIRELGALVLDGLRIVFGVRFGNSKADFETPVLVIGAETAIGIKRSNMMITLDIIKDNIRKILNIGMDEYFLATEI